MDITHKTLHSAWNEYASLMSQKNTIPDPLEAEELLSSFFCPGPFYYYVFDFPTRSYSYLHRNITLLFDVDPSCFTVNDFIDLVHPDDVPHMANGERMAFEFIINRMPPEKRKKYKISYCLRLRTKRGRYKLFLQQAMALTLDEDGNLGKVLGVHSDISHLTTINNHKISFIGMDGEPSYHSVCPTEFLGNVNFVENILTKREIEIIGLMAEGFTASEIADKLNLSTATINTHKKNILSKTECKNTAGLIAMCIREGLI